MIRVLRLAAALIAAICASSAALAQNNPLVGVWSHTSYTSKGEVFASFFMQFMPDGSMQERILTTAGQSDYVGVYRFDPNQGVVQFQMNDYEPKFVPPTIQLGLVYNMPVQFSNQNTMVIMDGSGPMEYHRQQ